MVSLTNDCSVSHWVDKRTVEAKRASFESSGVLGSDIHPSTKFIFFFKDEILFIILDIIN